MPKQRARRPKERRMKKLEKKTPPDSFKGAGSNVRQSKMNSGKIRRPKG